MSKKVKLAWLLCATIFLRSKLDNYIQAYKRKEAPLISRIAHYLSESTQHFLQAIESLYFVWIVLKDWFYSFSTIARFRRWKGRVFQRLRGLNNS